MRADDNNIKIDETGKESKCRIGRIAHKFYPFWMVDEAGTNIETTGEMKDENWAKNCVLCAQLDKTVISSARRTLTHSSIYKQP